MKFSAIRDIFIYKLKRYSNLPNFKVIDLQLVQVKKNDMM